MFPLLKKELKSYFTSINAYIIASIFILLTSLFLWFFENNYNIFNIGIASLNSFFSLIPWLLLFLIPALSMKSIAEEQQTGTLYWLFSQPIKISSLVVAKYLAVFLLIIFCLLPTLVYLYTVDQFALPIGNIDKGTIYSGYIGLIFLSLTFCSIGIFASSLAKNQVMAFIFGIIICFFLFFGFESLASYNLLGSFDYTLQKIGIYSHYTSFIKGIVDTRDIAYFIFLISIFLLLSIFLVEYKKL